MNLADTVTSQVVSKELELAAKGFTDDQIKMSIKRALNYSKAISNKAPISARQETYIALVSEELDRSERWLLALEEAAKNGYYNRGIKRAARDDRLREGFHKFGLPGSDVPEKWESSLDGAINEWENTVSRR